MRSHVSALSPFARYAGTGNGGRGFARRDQWITTERGLRRTLTLPSPGLPGEGEEEGLCHVRLLGSPYGAPAERAMVPVAVRTTLPSRRRVAEPGVVFMS